MRRFLFFVFMLFLSSSVFAVDTKVSDLTTATPVLTDNVYIVDDPGGTPSSKKTTVGDILATGADLDSSGEVTNDSHNHTTTTVSGIDIADDTDLSVNTPLILSGSTITINDLVNADISASAAISMSKTALIAGTNLTLSTDTLNVDDAFVLNTGDTMTSALTLADTSLKFDEASDTMTISVPALTAARSVTFPDAAGEVSLLGQTIGSAEMADADHGDVSWSSGTATVEDLQCTDCIGTTEIADSYVLNTTDSMSGNLTIAGSLALTGHASCLELETDGSGNIVCAADDAGGGGTPGGSDTQVQFNDGGSFGGDSGLTFIKATDFLTVAGTTSTAGLTVSGTVTFAGLDCSGNANGGALTADANGDVSCTDDDGGGASGDIVTVNSTAVDTTANFLDGDIDFTHVDGGAGGPDDITATVGCTGCVDTTDILDDTVALADSDHSITLAGNPALAASQCYWSATGLICEGTTADTIETLVTFRDPTSTDKTITFPNDTGDVAVTNATGLIARTGTGTHANRTMSVGSNAGLSISNGNGASGNPTYSLNTSTALTGDHSLTANAEKFGQSGIIFEGATADTIETYFSITDPTSSDKTITFPNATGEVSLLAQTIDDTEMTNEDFGDFTCTGAEDGCTVDANAIALATDTTGNFVATVADAGNTTISVSGSGSENAAVTLDAIDLNCTDCIGTTEIADSYVLNTGDTVSGNLSVTGSLALTGHTSCLELETDASGNIVCAADDAGGGDNVSIDGVGVTDPDFVSTGDIDFVDTSNTVTANIKTGVIVKADLAVSTDFGDVSTDGSSNLLIDANAVALATDTTGDYVSDITAGGHISSTGATSGENISHTLSIDDDFVLNVGDTMTGRLLIDGSADETQLTVQGHSTQTVSGTLFQVENSSASELVSANNDGDMTVTGTLSTDGGIKVNSTADSAIDFGGVTADPCGSFTAGTIFYNSTSNYFCYCDGTNDLKMNDNTTPCF